MPHTSPNILFVILSEAKYTYYLSTETIQNGVKLRVQDLWVICKSLTSGVDIKPWQWLLLILSLRTKKARYLSHKHIIQ